MKKLYLLLVVLIITFPIYISAQVDKSDWVGEVPDGCTSITCGKRATIDGSVITSHTDDSHRTRSSIFIQPALDHPEGSRCDITHRVPCDTFAMPLYVYEKIGIIPQVNHTYAYVNSAYPCINEHQLAIGESTFGGRESMQSDKGLIDCTMLCQLMVERCTTARQAIAMAGELTAKYGYNDAGECLTIADKKEVWHLEILGPGKDQVGSVWAAQRVPDDHVSVNANASRIRKINLKDKDYFMASENIFKVAIDSGWCTSKDDFEFCYAYAPESRTTLASRRREWRVFDLVAPSLNLDPNAENYPFSVKPDSLVTLPQLVSIFKDYYEGTPFDMTKDMTVTGDDGKSIISPLANPHMPYDANKLFKINGGWGWLGERTIARWYTMYATIIQCREWLPDPVGGVVWLAMDNVATSVYIPVYCGVTDLPEPYKVDGRIEGFSNKSAWWAFNRLGTLTAQRWGDMRHDVDAIWNPIQQELFDRQKSVEQQAVQMYREDPGKTKAFLTRYSGMWGSYVVDKAWKLGDYLWTKYDEKF
ncbi:MAG: C69 family dipeptidase [Bacteroidales bacterium]|jgi:dipeptidase|nr:C69 family dipeptidase [Bacteroidales bacterium]